MIYALRDIRNTTRKGAIQLFTGLVEAIGIVRRIQQVGDSAHLDIEAPAIVHDIHVGDSIAVNGVCLTVVTYQSHGFTADAVPETMRRTNLGKLVPGDAVNLERALLPTTRLGGHIVSGHVDGQGRVQSILREGNALVFTISVADELARYIVGKGSVCLNGVSLTVMDTTEHTFRVSIIPHTGAATTLLQMRVGDLVNVECDILAKYLERLLGFRSPQAESADVQNAPVSRLSLSLLKENGFV